MTALSDEAIERLRLAVNWPEFASERYTVTEQIGRGGMGTVYAALDTELGRDVAIKVSNTVSSPAFERRLAAEARVLATLEHPGIVPVHDVGRLADGRTFYVMKRVHGTTLGDYLSRDIDLGERLRIFERVCEAVAFAHARRILHRDLKPANIMVGSFGEVMVMDWGVATTIPDRGAAGDRGGEPAAEGRRETVERSTKDGTVVGTHGFMAPEQARGERVDELSDVYSLGAILLALMRKDEASVDAATEASSPAAKFPAPLRSICGRALRPRPADRYPSAAALREDVARYRAGQGVHAHRETPFERAGRFARVYRMPILLVLAYMIMRAIVAVVTSP
jgi:serine/threonine protein kinase